MKNNAADKKLLLHIITPFIIFVLCIGIVLIALIKPSDRLKVYINLAFMDEFKSNPTDENYGLIIKNNDIVEEYSGEYSENGEIIRPKYGELYAILKSDSLDLSIPVYWGSDLKLFENGACQSTGSVVIGDKGNSVISAHEDTFFAELYKLEVGDKITLKTNYGEFIYTVKEQITFKKTNNKYVNPSKDTKLTLYTCKKNILGSSDERIGVICELTEKKFYNFSKEDLGN